MGRRPANAPSDQERRAWLLTDLRERATAADHPNRLISVRAGDLLWLLDGGHTAVPQAA